METEKKIVSNFIRTIIDNDKQSGKWQGRVETRFPPEPNGYLHIGHAKSICLNFGIAKDYEGTCHLRFDDTNPEKENDEFVQSIVDAVRWLGFSWEKNGQTHLYYASDYFEKLYLFAEKLIEYGLAYVDSQLPEDIQRNRGNLTSPGTNSAYRQRTASENLDLFRRMKQGEFQDGEHVLRAKIDMASPNMNMRDPVLYRIRHVHHHRTGQTWCIYPMYDYTHCISDALENITHSLCTLEFEDHRPLYEWTLEQLAKIGEIKKPLPQQIEFARLNLTYTVTSKRKLAQLVSEAYVDGWDDPRLSTLAGIRRRGFTPESIRSFCEQIGISKADSWIDINVLEQSLRDDLDPVVPRAVAVLNPLKLIIDNFPENHIETCHAAIHPHHPEQGQRTLLLSKELWIEREDFNEIPPKGYFRLFPGNRVRLRYGFVIECTGCDKDSVGNVIAVHCNYFADSKSGTAGADTYKVKGNIHWLSTAHAYEAEVRLYERLFQDPHPDAGDKNFLDVIQPDSKKTISAYLEPQLQSAKAGEHFQFERHGYFVADCVDSKAMQPVFNRSVSLKQAKT